MFQAFPQGSPYLPDISKAILNTFESRTLRKLEESMLSSGSCPFSGSRDNNPSLGVRSFMGLFAITGGTTTVSLFVFIFRLISQKRNKLGGIKRGRHRKGGKWMSSNKSQHNPGKDEILMFDWEMKNQGHWP